MWGEMRVGVPLLICGSGLDRRATIIPIYTARKDSYDYA